MSADIGTIDHSSRRSRRDRLTTTLIFALLAHGIILLGIGFKSLVPARPPGAAVNITLTTTRAAKAPQQADYLGRFNQFGPGNTRVRVPERPRAFGQPFARSDLMLAEQLTRSLPNALLRKTFAEFEAPHPTVRQALITTTADSYRAHGQLLQPSDNHKRAVILQLSAPRQGQPNELALDAVELPQRYGPQPEAQARTVNARAALYAPYLLNWQQRIEQVGTAQFARLVPAAIQRGHLSLAITLGSDGSVRSITIVRRSRHPELDAAALKIIRLAAPFAPFPPELSAHTDQLSFTYRWNFLRHAGEGALGIGGP